MRMQTGFNLVHGDDSDALTDKEREIVEHMCILLLSDAMENGPSVLDVDPSRVVMGPRLVAASIKHHVIHHSPHFLDDLPNMQRRVEQSLFERDHMDEDDATSSSCSDDDNTAACEEAHLASCTSTRETLDRIERDWQMWTPTDPLLKALKRSVTSTCMDMGIT